MKELGVFNFHRLWNEFEDATHPVAGGDGPDAGVKTLPIWIFQEFSRPRRGPIVNAVGLFAILLSIIPVYLAQRLTEERPSPAPPPARRRPSPDPLQ